MGRPTLLLVDDDEDTRSYLEALLTPRGYEVVTAASGEEALARLAAGPAPGLVLLDLVMPGMDGLAVLDRMQRAHPTVPVIILSTVGQLRTVVDAVKRGASDYLTKPFEDQELGLAVQNALEKQRLRNEVRSLKRKLDRLEEPGDLVSCHPTMLRLKEIARQVADTDAPVLLLGESGVGKEVVARFIHAQSPRCSSAFVKVNCAALPNELLESELFGYERGAFSGALREKPGRFELADRGSILLDEIGEMSSHLQAKLLHVLQDGQYNRLGGRQTMHADARVLASTNSRLDEAVAQGRFREDLFFRLNVIRLEVPPLRHRKEDVPLLCRHFLEIYRQRYRRDVDDLPKRLLDAFLRYDWPGNVRELENAVRRYVILPDLDMALGELAKPVLSPGSPQPMPLHGVNDDLSLKDASARAAEGVERELVQRVLSETRWNRREAARRLRISYKALLNKLKRWDVEPPSSAGTAGHAKPVPRVD